jgi:hypothetical protein
MGRNQTTWKKGMKAPTGAGRPKKEDSLTEILKIACNDEIYQKDGTTLTVKELIAEKLINLALKDGNVAALKYVYDRIEGLPKAEVKQTGEIKIVIDSEDNNL